MRDSRFIPAGAGNSRPLRNSRPDPNGLSPLARGTLNIINYNRQGARFIPAGAGNSACSASPLASAAVYPRWRGELCVSVSPRVCESGLSPLARGTLSLNVSKRIKGRFIPAGAGNSSRGNHTHYATAVYPRWRGELSKSIHLFLKHFFP